MYLVGEGVHKDPSQGIKWITKAAENGHSGAQMEL
jgi:TPR repeat protein